MIFWTLPCFGNSKNLLELLKLRWCDGEPNNAGGSIFWGNVSEGCVRYETRSQCTQDISCRSVYPYICEIKLESSNLATKDQSENLCDSKWTYFDGSCYFRVENNLNFTAAKKDCENKDATLAIPDSNEEFAFLKTLFDQTFYISGLITGLWYQKEQNIWVWCFISLNKILNPSSTEAQWFRFLKKWPKFKKI